MLTRFRFSIRGTRPLQLQLLAAATAINLKRLLSHQDALGHTQTGDLTARLRSIRWLTDLLTRRLNAIDRLTATDSLKRGSSAPCNEAGSPLG